jgi:hypothetical protein
MTLVPVKLLLWTLPAAALLAAGAGLAGLGCSKPCQGSACAAITPVTLVLSCDGSQIVQSSLTGTCAGQMLACQDPAEAGLDGCITASFGASGPGECDVALTFANGFVYTGSFTFSYDSSGTALVPSPQIVPVYCAPESDAGDAGDASGGDAGDD